MKTALIVVDIQNDYFPGGHMELVGIDEASTKAKDLLSFFRENQWPTFHIQHIAIRKGATFFLPDTKGVEIHESVKPLPKDLVIQKHFPNAFRETALLEELTKAEVKRVVICGAMSHLCIDATTRAAADFGLNCILIHDGCATRDLEFGGRKVKAGDVHASFMSALGFAYARMMNVSEFLLENKK